ncbi:MAG: hypothetical protein SO108_02000 [Bacilli bacterium]|nr:hypothetical protein [Bacilli bacterium]
MKNIIEKFWKFVDKIGKPNFVLVVLILFFIAVTGLYQTFSLYTSSEGATVADGVKTYQFILNNDNTENTVLVPANSSKKYHVTISNSEDKSLKYGVYYNSSSDLSYVNLGYLKYSTYQPNGVIPSNGKYEVSLRIDNNSDSDIPVKIGVSYGLENGGDLELSANSHWFGEANDLLSDMVAGSFVQYAGNNGCAGKACEGQNANYKSNSDLGYCYDSNYKYNANGWRIAYIKDGSAYLTSAGSPECMCTSSNGTAGTSCSDSETTAGIPKHLENLNTKALTYCSSAFAYGRKCDSNSAWNMGDADFKEITGDSLSDHYLSDGYYDNYSVINNGGYYWYGTATSASTTTAYSWRPISRSTYNSISSYTFGVRPVIRLSSSVFVTGGTGTSEDPYIISTGKLSSAYPGSYVKYTGNNGCSGKACEGQNANYVSDTNMGYCANSSFKFNANGWRIAYIKDDTAYLTSAGSPECMCTNSAGTAGTSCSNWEDTSGVPKHLANLNKKALTYCNSTYAYGGKCDSASAWNMADADFKTITGDTLSTAYEKSNYDSYSIINNGGFYWFATPYNSSSVNVFTWYPNSRNVSNGDFGSGDVRGVRPVLRLQSSVLITGGSGTYKDPYIISNR